MPPDTHAIGSASARRGVASRKIGVRRLSWVAAAATMLLVFVTASTHAASADIEAGANAHVPAQRMLVQERSEPHRLVGYFPSWGIYERKYEVADIPATSLTHVNYAFANLVDGRCSLGDPWADVERPLPTDDLSLPYRGNFNQLSVLKQTHPHLRTIISVGGSTWSGGFSAATATASQRRSLALSCVEFMDRYGFDGLSIDWEYPVSGGASPGAPADRVNYTALLREIRLQLDALEKRAGGEHMLTIAGPAGAPNMANIEIDMLASLVDWVNVMSYDFAGAWSPRTGHHSPLFEYAGIEDSTFTIDSAMRRWELAGMPRRQLNLGLAFYGRAFGGVAAPRPGQPFSSVPNGTTEPGQFDYAHLVGGELAETAIRFDEAARVPYSYDAAADVWYSFDDPRSIEEKARYATTNGYGGVLMWELSNDTADHALLRAAVLGLGR